MPLENNFKVLLIEDNPGDATLARERLSEMPEYTFPTIHAPTLREALEALKDSKFDAAIVDLSLPDSQGIETVRKLRNACEDIPIIVLSGANNEAWGREAIAAGAQDYIGKNDFHVALLARSVLYALERHRGQELQRQLQKLVTSNPDAVVVLDVDGVVKFVNEAALELFNRTQEEFLGEKLGFSVEPGKVMEVEVISGTENRTAEIHVVEFDWKGESALLVSLRDVTERNKLASQLRQSQKLEALGQLAAGVAHDFNNLLTVIGGYTELLSSDWHGDDATLDMLNQVLAASNRAASLTRQLLAFGRKTIIRPVTFDINVCITEIEKMLRRLIGEHIELVSDLDPSIESVFADPGQMEQIIVNLAVNARDAMPDGGTLCLKTETLHLSEEYSPANGNLPAGRYVRFSISDSGTGMSVEVQSRIFEPFFTTKALGKGTGLGLATVYGIVQQTGGHISVTSESGKGTTFEVLLPTKKMEAVAKGPGASPNRNAAGTETILLVEDEPALRELAEKVLRSKGYSVLVAMDNKDVLRLAEHHPGKIHLMLTDVVLPGQSGTQLAEIVLTMRPDIKVLYMSGHTDDSIVSLGSLTPCSSFLQKPFSPGTLAQRVRDVIDCDPSGTE